MRQNTLKLGTEHTACSARPFLGQRRQSRQELSWDWDFLWRGLSVHHHLHIPLASGLGVCWFAGGLSSMFLLHPCAMESVSLHLCLPTVPTTLLLSHSTRSLGGGDVGLLYCHDPTSVLILLFPQWQATSLSPSHSCFCPKGRVLLSLFLLPLAETGGVGGRGNRIRCPAAVAAACLLWASTRQMVSPGCVPTSSPFHKCPVAVQGKESTSGGMLLLHLWPPGFLYDLLSLQWLIKTLAEFLPVCMAAPSSLHALTKWASAHILPPQISWKSYISEPTSLPFTLKGKQQ